MIGLSKKGQASQLLDAVQFLDAYKGSFEARIEPIVRQQEIGKESESLLFTSEDQQVKIRDKEKNRNNFAIDSLMKTAFSLIDKV